MTYEKPRGIAVVDAGATNTKIVLFDGSERHRGQLMDLKITRVGSFTLYGDPAIVGL